MSDSVDEASLRLELERYKFYHVIQLTDGIETPGNPAYRSTQALCMKYLDSLDLEGKRVLDIGCRDGLFSFAAEKRGAAEVVGIDNDLSVPATEFLIPFFKSKVRMEQVNVYDLDRERFGLFDVVIFPGVLYHLRYPFSALKAIREVMAPGGDLIVETAIWRGDRRNAMLFCPTGEESPYESTSCTFFNEKGLLDTLESMGFEAVSVEYLPWGFREWINVVRRRPASLLRWLFPWRSQPIQAVVRCVVHARYKGLDTETFEFQYWESTHDYHTQHGG